MSKNKRMMLALLCVAAAAILAFIVMPLMGRSTRAVAPVVRIVGSEPIPRGTLLTEKDLRVVEVGSYGLPDDVAKSIDSCVGLFTVCDIYPNDNITTDKVSSSIPKDENLYGVERGTCAVSVSVRSLSAGFSGKLQEGDVVSVYGVREDEMAANGVNITLDQLLQYMEIMSVTNSKAASADASDVTTTEQSIPATITFRCTPNQAVKLIELEKIGSIHVAFVGRTEDAKAQLAAFNKAVRDKGQENNG